MERVANLDRITGAKERCTCWLDTHIEEVAEQQHTHQGADRWLPKLTHLAHTRFGMPDVTSIKLGRGGGSIPATTGHISALLLTRSTKRQTG